MVSARQGEIDFGGRYANLNRYVLGWLLNLGMVCWDLTISGNLFHSTGVAMSKTMSAFRLFEIEETACMSY